MRTSLAALAVVVAVAVAPSGCGEQAEDASPDGPPSTDIEGSWVLASGHDVGGRELRPVLGRGITLDVSVVDGELSGASACNQYFASFTLDHDLIELSGVGGTEMACEPEVMELEGRYLAALRAVGHATRDEGRLKLWGESVELLFDPRPPAQDAELVGTTWHLESLVDGDTVSSVAGEGTLTLRSDGVLEAWTGCSAVSGVYRLENNTVVVSRASVRARTGCARHVSAQSDHLTDLLRDRFTVEVQGDRLTVMSPEGKGADFRVR